MPPHVAQSGTVSSPDNVVGYGMATLGDATSNAGKGGVYRREPQKYQRKSISTSSAHFQQAQIPNAGTGRFKGEALTLMRKRIDAFDHQPASGKSTALLIERR